MFDVNIRAPHCQPAVVVFCSTVLALKIVLVDSSASLQIAGRSESTSQHPMGGSSLMINTDSCTTRLQHCRRQPVLQAVYVLGGKGGVTTRMLGWPLNQYNQFEARLRYAEG